MKQARDLITDTLPANQPLSPDDPRPNVKPLDERAAQIVNKLFIELAKILPGAEQRWVDQDRLDTDKRTWTKAFIAARISRLEQIRFGLMRLRTLNRYYLPSAGQFIELCSPTPELLNLPPVEKAYQEALRHSHESVPLHARWSHDAVYHAACLTRFDRLFSMSYETGFKAFSENYTATCQAIVRGETLRKPPKHPGLPEPKSQPDMKKGNAALAAMRAMVKGRHRPPQDAQEEEGGED